jgi:GH24 family phage-related lysozyme (muramidase)
MKILEYIMALFVGMTPVKANDVPLSLDISQEAIDLIIYYEVGGKSYYEKYLSKPTVPAWQTTASGVTIGIGFDVGHNTKEQVKKALDGVLPENEIKLLQSVSGLKGRSAYYNGLPKVKHTVKVSYIQAEKIFKNDSLPRFTKQTADAFRITKDRLHPHSNGALTSLVYNRGGSMSNTESRKEMRWIRYNISTNREDRVPSDIRSMKRLWSYTKLKGLHLRRDAEAKLFQKGLDEAKKR